MKKDLLFYHEYQQFYQMAGTSPAFSAFCQDAFGADFSQDGFSDLQQVDMILEYIPTISNPHILDIGCGNGKMLQYLQQKTDGYIYGFDYSENAIQQAIHRCHKKSEFQVGVIGEIDYPSHSFDIAISMDSIYFAQDMTQFTGQVSRWLKPGGIFFIGYEEGDVMPKTFNSETTVLAQSLRQNHISYQTRDLTRQTWELLKKKRESILRHQKNFEEEGLSSWYSMILHQTDYAMCSFEEFCKNHSRYLFIAQKP